MSLSHHDIKPGDTLKARYSYDHGKLEAGKEYTVVAVEPPLRAEHFTFPAYVTVSHNGSKPYTSHLHHYEKV